MSNGVFSRDSHRTVTTNFDDGLYYPETDDMLDDRLEEARQNRTGFYRKMLASRNRPLDDYSVSRKITHRSGSSPAKEPSISDPAPAGPLPQIPEPHSSWRFYTSYDNGEWKRHAVPVHKEEEEILREPTKIVRRVRDSERSTHSPTVESSLRKMRQSGGPLLACLQPRPRRTSEGQKTSTTVHMVNGQPVFGGEFGGQFGLPADWANINGNVVRRYSDGGSEYLVLEEEPVQGSMKQEVTTKYTSTVKVTQPNGSHVRQGVSGGQITGVAGGVEDGHGAAGEAGVRKSRRPRIYGFQEKIIIPTKYKNAENQESGGEEKVNDVNAGQSVSKTREETTVRKSPFLDDGLGVKERRVGEVGGRVQVTETSQSASGGSRPLKDISVAPDRAVPGKTVKVVVMNSSSDGESEKKSLEALSSEEEKEDGDKSPARKLTTGMPEGFIQLPNLFQDGPLPIEGIRAYHESLHANLIPTASSVKEGAAGSVSTVEDQTSLNPNQRVFSKDEQTFSEVGPDGSKHDGKVLRTYEVITTGNEEDSTVENKLLAPTKEVTVVPIESSPFKMRSISSRVEERPTITNMLEQSGSHFSQPIEKVESSPFKTTIISSTGGNWTTKTNMPERSGSHFSQPIDKVESSPFKTTIISSTGGNWTTKTNMPERSGSHFSQPIEKVESSPFKTRIISSTGGDRITKTNMLEQSGGHFSPQEDRSPRKTVPAVSPKTDRKIAPDIFEQTGSLFKTITPRPRNIRDSDSVFAAREEHLRKASGGESVQPKFGGVTTTSRTIRISSNQPDGLKRESNPSERASGNVGAAETVRTRVEHVVSTENHPSRQLHPSGSAEGRISVRDSFGSFANEDGGFSQSNTNSGVRSHGWSDTTEMKKSNVRTKEKERDWEVQVALKE